jgi:hypothetical protein
VSVLLLAVVAVALRVVSRLQTIRGVSPDRFLSTSTLSEKRLGAGVSGITRLRDLGGLPRGRHDHARSASATTVGGARNRRVLRDIPLIRI